MRVKGKLLNRKLAQHLLSSIFIETDPGSGHWSFNLLIVHVLGTGLTVEYLKKKGTSYISKDL